jgi:hypothetical protein
MALQLKRKAPETIFVVEDDAAILRLVVPRLRHHASEIVIVSREDFGALLIGAARAYEICEERGHHDDQADQD